MKINKLSIAVLFLSGSVFYAQETKRDTLAKEKKIEGVVIQGSSNKKTETAVLGEQKKAIIQKQAVSAEEISRKGISNVEQGLTKVTGITTVEGRGLFVRGLEERYNYLLINGLGSPSNNPFQKIIALKQFPTDVVGKLNIYKTFNSNLYGDFAGATFDIETLTIDKPFTKVEFSVGVNTLSTFRDNFKVAEGADGMNGYIGLNSRDRKLPNEIRNARPSTYNFSKDQSLNSFKDSWNVNNVKSLPNTSIGFTTVQKVKAGETGTLGVLFSLNQGSKFTYKEGANNQYRSQGETDIIFNNNLNRKQYVYETESSILLGLGYKNKGTNINLNAIYLQNSANIIEDNFGYKDQKIQNKDDGFFRTNQLDISRFLDLQLTASQKINDRNQVKGGISYVINNYSQPDRKIFDGNQINLKTLQKLPDGQLYLRYGSNNLIRQYLDVDSRFYGSAFAEYSLSLGEKGDKKEYPLQIAFGYNGFTDFRKNSYRYVFGYPNDITNTDVIIDIDKPDAMFNQSIANGQVHYREGSDVSQYYSSIYQIINGGYVNINYKPNETWDILLGARYEKDMTLIRYYDTPSASEKTNLDKTRDLFLPSLSVKKSLNSKNNLRFSFSKTVTRPILIETMPIEYISPDNVSIIGNQFIKSSDNYNVDLKWEYFPTNKEMFAINAFAKRINNPIERSLAPSANATGTTITFYNAEKAELFGVELEGILSLSRISESLRNFTFGANATFMYSNVERSEQQYKTEKPYWITDRSNLHKRGLQGASPYTINADLKYEHKNKKNLSQIVSLVYNVSGSKIYATGGNGTDNYYEKPFHQLDLVYQNQLTKNWNVKFAVQNILNNKYRVLIGDKNYAPLNTNGNNVLTDYYRGVNFNLTVGYTF
ncbi:TonB-dependent receptor plug domain-containing protein [Chryseobacterium jejuense]|uniref:Outer membrane receptor for ferrienterochelin and colicins n=1 Tax=Chryseobacterium jejuense TaxID=445960 RepID=A0A2X2XS80_CHRJE|nr:TonB-dependent receptor plug domain-containing protein [Chryseobacterium jejuense]SDJ22760.1 Outer membrane receptor proteins, mostly Fe transport [Chryseobacterium jejuense]SQB28669.1 Outer membrane receptor for ferrienterochelin and colicins [Chryseobacterium jejuense]